jgi:hypothetical protein
MKKPQTGSKEILLNFIKVNYGSNEQYYGATINNRIEIP